MLRGIHSLSDLFDRCIPDPTTGCWLWALGIDKKGYGCAWFDGLGYRTKAHRIAWVLANGPIPDGLCVLHRCDTPACCNPTHLFLGTIADNNADMMAKNRHVSVPGVRKPLAKLNDARVSELRRLYETGTLSTRALAARFGVGKTVIWRVISGRGWRHVVQPDITTPE